MQRAGFDYLLLILMCCTVFLMCKKGSAIVTEALNVTGVGLDYYLKCETFRSREKRQWQKTKST